jgi:hypothetical protein
MKDSWTTVISGARVNSSYCVYLIESFIGREEDSKVEFSLRTLLESSFHVGFVVQEQPDSFLDIIVADSAINIWACTVLHML